VPNGSFVYWGYTDIFGPLFFESAKIEFENDLFSFENGILFHFGLNASLSTVRMIKKY